MSSCHCGDTRLAAAIFLGESPWPSGTGCVPNCKQVNSQASFPHWHGASEPATPHWNPHGCQRWRMAQYVHLITPVNTARASPSCWDLLWSILATCSSPTMQLNEMKLWDNLELSAQQRGQEQGLDCYYCVYKHSGFMVKALYWKATGTRL